MKALVRGDGNLFYRFNDFEGLSYKALEKNKAFKEIAKKSKST